MTFTLGTQVRSAYKRFGKMPPVMHEDLQGELNEETFAQTVADLCKTFRISAEQYDTLQKARALVVELVILCVRQQHIHNRVLYEDANVTYVGLGSVTEQFVIKCITPELMVKLQNGQICDPTWLQRV